MAVDVSGTGMVTFDLQSLLFLMLCSGLYQYPGSVSYRPCFWSTGFVPAFLFGVTFRGGTCEVWRYSVSLGSGLQHRCAFFLLDRCVTRNCFSLGEISSFSDGYE